MQLIDLLNLKGKTRFRLRLELTLIVFALLASQVLLLRIPPLELLVTLLVALYIAAAAKELKTRHERFTERQKQVLFGVVGLGIAAVVVALLIAWLMKRNALLWIVFGLAAVLSFVALFHDYEQLYKDGDSA